MVEDSAWRADDEVDAFAKSLDLAIHTFAAVDRQDANAVVRCEFGGFIANLRGEFASRDEDECSGIAVSGGLPAFKVRQQVGGGFTRARLGLPHDIRAGENARYERLLDTAGLFVAGFGDGVENSLRESETVKPCNGFHNGRCGQFNLQVNGIPWCKQVARSRTKSVRQMTRHDYFATESLRTDQKKESANGLACVDAHYFN